MSPSVVSILPVFGDETSQYYGRCFLITNNSRTTLTLDMSNSADEKVQMFLPISLDGTSVEVIPAATLGTIFELTMHPQIGSATSWRELPEILWTGVCL